MDKVKMLLIDDSEEVFVWMQHCLKGVAILDYASCKSEALDKFYANEFDIVFIDLMLQPGQEDGFNILESLREIRLESRAIYLLLTENNDKRNEVKGHALGVTEYLRKPLTKEILLALVTKYRRLLKEAEIVLPPFLIDKKSYRVFQQTVEGGYFDLDFTKKEAEILLCLAAAPNKIFSRDEILERIWTSQMEVSSRTLDMHISSIRKKLGPYKKMIKSIWGVGYQLVYK